MAGSRYAALRRNRVGRRRAQAAAFARLALREMAACGLDVRLVGSLARGEFDEASDVDFLLIGCPGPMKYTIEARLEDMAPAGLAFDVIYLDEVREPWRSRLLGEAVAEISDAA